MIPGFNLSTVGTVRDGAKWPTRDRRSDAAKRDRISFDVLSPFTVGRMIEAGLTGVEFLAVNTDNSKSVAKVAPFLSSKGFDNLIVPLDTGAEVQQQMQVGGMVPFLLLYDGEGRPVADAPVAVQQRRFRRVALEQ